MLRSMGSNVFAQSGGGAVGASRRVRRPKIGLALGAGVARGWAHIGVLRELEAAGLQFDVIAGTSAGAVVGGAYAAGKLDGIEAFARSLTKRGVLSLIDISFAGHGIIGGAKLKSRLEKELPDSLIEALPLRFAAVATEIGSGHEIWLTKGRLSDAMRASYAMPGLFEPVRASDRWLVDGALTNPVPVSVCRALGAEIVIAVNLVVDAVGRSAVIHDTYTPDQSLDQLIEAAPPGKPGEFGFFDALRDPGKFFRQARPQPFGAPSIASVMVDAYNITQDRIVRSRLAGDPPDVLINARLGRIGLFDFHRAAESIDIGRDVARRSMAEISACLGLAAPQASGRMIEA